MEDREADPFSGVSEEILIENRQICIEETRNLGQ